MITAAVLGTGLVAAGAVGTAAAGAAGAYWYKKKQKRKAKKKKAFKENCVFGQHLEEITRLSPNELPEVFDYVLCWLQTNCKYKNILIIIVKLIKNNQRFGCGRSFWFP